MSVNYMDFPPWIFEGRYLERPKGLTCMEIIQREV